MNCPTDRGALRRQTHEGSIEVDGCPTCGGMWLDHGELEAVQATNEHDHAAELSRFPDVVGAAYARALAAAKPPVTCPRCAREMERREHGYCSQILIDVCPGCRGVWLEAGEIKALEVFFERTKSATGDARRGFLASLRNLILA